MEQRPLTAEESRLLDIDMAAEELFQRLGVAVQPNERKLVIADMFTFFQEFGQEVSMIYQERITEIFDRLFSDQ